MKVSTSDQNLQLMVLEVVAPDVVHWVVPFLVEVWQAVERKDREEVLWVISSYSEMCEVPGDGMGAGKDVLDCWVASDHHLC